VNHDREDALRGGMSISVFSDSDIGRAWDEMGISDAQFEEMSPEEQGEIIRAVESMAASYAAKGARSPYTTITGPKNEKGPVKGGKVRKPPGTLRSVTALINARKAAGQSYEAELREAGKAAEQISRGGEAETIRRKAEAHLERIDPPRPEIPQALTPDRSRSRTP
jgi:hypothetical protein